MALRKTYISATTGKPFHAPELPQSELQKYSQLMGRLQVAAREYDGSNYRRVVFMTLARDIAKMADGSADLVDAYAHQAYPHNNSVFSLDDLFLNARARLRGTKDEESPFGLILKRFQEYDSKVGKQSKPLDIEKNLVGRKNYQPRLAAIIDVLCEQSRGIERLSITTGPYTLPQQLRGSYVILSIKNSALKIAVCDDTSMPTYISMNSEKAEFWKEPGIKSIRSYDFDSYMEQIHKALAYIPNPHPQLHTLAGSVIILPPISEADEEDKPLKAKPVKRPAPAADKTASKPETDALSQTAFTWASLPHPEAPPEEPEDISVATTAPDFTIAAGKAMRTARGPRNDPEARFNKIAADIVSFAAQTRKWPSPTILALPDMPCSLWQAHDQWLHSQGQSLAKVVSNLVHNLALLHEQRTGEKPSRHSGDIPEAPNLSWAIIDDCYKSKQTKIETLDIILHADDPGQEERIAAEKLRRHAHRQHLSI